MIRYTQRAERLRRRQAFDAKIHTRSDILKPDKKPSVPLQAFIGQLEPGLDYVADRASILALNGNTSRLPHGLRCSRLAFSPVVQNAIGDDGRVNGVLVRKMPETLEETQEFFASVCPVKQSDWRHLCRLVYFDPHGLASLIYPIRAQNESIFCLLLSREHRLALKHWPALAEIPDNTVGFRGRLIDLCVGYAELERADGLGEGLAELTIDTKEVRAALSDHTTFLAAIRSGSSVGDFLLNMFIEPAMFASGTPVDGAPFGTWWLPNRLSYDPLEDLRYRERFEAFRSSLLIQETFAGSEGQRRVNPRALATYWGATLAQLSDIIFIKLGDLVIRNRGPNVSFDAGRYGVGDRSLSVVTLSDSFRARHDPAFAIKLATREGAPERLSTLQKNRDLGNLMAPQAGMPGHSCAIDGLNWLLSEPDLPLWKALATAPPPGDWEIDRGIPGPAREAFEAMRDIHSIIPRICRGSVKGFARLMGGLATGTGGLSMLPSYSKRLHHLVAHAPALRAAGWLPSKLGTKLGGGGNPRTRRQKNA